MANPSYPDGHYLNLPVMNETGEIVGMVDVLKLTYATLEQVSQGLSENRDSQLTRDADQLHAIARRRGPRMEQILVVNGSRVRFNGVRQPPSAESFSSQSRVA